MVFAAPGEVFKYHHSFGRDNRQAFRFDQNRIGKRRFVHVLLVVVAHNPLNFDFLAPDFDGVCLAAEIQAPSAWKRKHFGSEKINIPRGAREAINLHGNAAA